MSEQLSTVAWAEARLQPTGQTWFGVLDIAAALDVSPATVTRLIESGAFHPYARNIAVSRRNARYQVQRHAIIAWVRRNQM